MKKLLSLLMALTLVSACVGCGASEGNASSTDASASSEAEDTKSEGVMTYDEYVGYIKECIRRKKTMPFIVLGDDVYECGDIY